MPSSDDYQIEKARKILEAPERYPVEKVYQNCELLLERGNLADCSLLDSVARRAHDPYLKDLAACCSSQLRYNCSGTISLQTERYRPSSYSWARDNLFRWVALPVPPVQFGMKTSGALIDPFMERKHRGDLGLLDRVRKKTNVEWVSYFISKTIQGIEGIDPDHPSDDYNLSFFRTLLRVTRVDRKRKYLWLLVMGRESKPEGIARSFRRLPYSLVAQVSVNDRFFAEVNLFTESDDDLVLSNIVEAPNPDPVIKRVVRRCIFGTNIGGR